MRLIPFLTTRHSAHAESRAAREIAAFENSVLCLPMASIG